jgi:hypothetical protein
VTKTPTKENSIRSKVVPSLVTAAIISLVTTLIPGGWRWVFSKCHSGWLWLLDSTVIPIWFLVLLSLLALVLLVAVAVLIYASVRKAKDDPALGYTEDTFFGIRWRWRYGQHGIFQLCSFCPRCDLQVYSRHSSNFNALDSVVYHCDDCRTELHHSDVSHEEVENLVKRKIQQKIRREMSETQAT